MLKNLLQLYSIAICLISALIMLIVLATTIISLTNLLIPELKYQAHLNKYATNERYLEFKKQDAKDNTLAELNELTQQDVERKRIAERGDYLAEKRSDSISDLLHYLGWAISSALFFILHLRLYKRNIALEK